MKKTKIVCTIGPASENVTTLKKMIQAGMNVARLNFSHGTYAHHAMLIRNIRKAAADLGKNVAIMQDLQGPRIRTGSVAKEGITLERGDTVVLAHQTVADKLAVEETVVPVGFSQFHNSVAVGDHVLINDGLIDIEVLELPGDKTVVGKVVKPGVVYNHKGINLPGADIKTPVITAKDKQDLQFGLKQKVDFVALSFVKDASDIKQLRRLIGQYSKNGDVQVVAKVERQEALDNFDAILDAVDAIMVARGDLGIEISPAKVPLAQKEMIAKCMVAGKSAIVATQMMESMMVNPRPTRAEVSDVANAVIDHADAVMLSGESAFGKYPVETVRMMADVVSKTEQSRFDDLPSHALHIQHPTVEDDLSYAARDLAQHEHVKAIAVNSTSGRSARMMARHRPETRIIMLTHDKATVRKSVLTWGVEAVYIPKCRTLDTLITESMKAMQAKKIVKKGDNVVLVSSHPVGSGPANIVKLHTV